MMTRISIGKEDIFACCLQIGQIGLKVWVWQHLNVNLEVSCKTEGKDYSVTL